MGKTYDFSGWATKANLLCSDGRTIMKNAFAHHDGQTVPLCWNHEHNRPEEVLGHALLEARDEGVYAYCSFNDTESGQTAKLLVQHGDVNQMSIWANKLKQQGGNVIHGMIREVSLVLAGANPGAFIDTVMAHGDDACEEGSIYTGLDFEYVSPLSHAEAKDDKKEEEKEEKKEDQKEDEKSEKTEEDGEETVVAVIKTLTPKQLKAVQAMVGQAIEDTKASFENDSKDEVKHSKDESASEEKSEDSESEKTVEDILKTLTPEQETVFYAMVAQALGDEDSDEDPDDENEGGNDEMKQNVFDQETTNQEVLSHSEMQEIFADAKRDGSLRQAILSHGIEDIDILFPDAKALNADPEFIKRPDDWVAKVLGGVHHSPFARVKTVFADITAEQARAKGYHKGKLKIEEVFKLLKRTTNPTTVYKKQKLDRDDILDIDFNVIPWMKREMRMMLDEELARAYLVGDGRDPVDDADNKIDEECIRPIWKMEDLFTVKVAVTVEASATEEDKAKAFIKAVKKSRKNYRGSGNPSMYMSEDMLTDCLLIEDTNGRVIYDTPEKLAAALRVKEIIPVPVMEGLTRTTDGGDTFALAGIYVNLADYNVGTNKGGEVTMFSDFDIDYNAEKYLMETRCSGTLVKPYSAVAIEFKQA